MNSILRNIRLVISRAIAPTTIIHNETPDDVAQDRRDANLRFASATANAQKDRNYGVTKQDGAEVMVGHISTHDLTDLSSDYSRKAIISLGVWSALARGFNAYCRDPQAPLVLEAVNEFQCWNAVSPESEQMDEEQTLLQIHRFSVVKPKAGNDDTDAVIARITGKDIDTIRKDRLVKAEKKSAQREGLINNFNQLLWSTVEGDDFARMPAQKAFDKLQQTALWIAEWDGDGSRVAAELLLLESDMKIVKRIAKKAAGAAVDFENGTLTSDGLARRYA